VRLRFALNASEYQLTLAKEDLALPEGGCTCIPQHGARCALYAGLAPVATPPGGIPPFIWGMLGIGALFAWLGLLILVLG
jgi:hypothetical protein